MIARSIIGAAAVFAASVGLPSFNLAAPSAQQPSSASALTLLAADDIKWETTPRADTRRANLWGDSTKGPFGYFSRYDGGWQLPLHFHTNDLRGVIVSGTLVIHPAGQAAKELPAGSYFSVPGKTRHTDACKPGAACVIFFTGDAPLDRVNVDAPQAPPF